MDLALKIGFPVLGGALPFAVNKLTKKEFTTRTMAAVGTAFAATVTVWQNRAAIREYAIKKKWLSSSAKAEHADDASSEAQDASRKSDATPVASNRVHWFTAAGTTVWQCIRPSAEDNEDKAVCGNHKSKLCAAIALAVSAFVVTKLGVGITIVSAGIFAAATFGAAQLTKHIPYIIKGKFAETPAAVVTALALVNYVFAYAHQFTAVQNYVVPVLSKIAVPVIGSKLPLMGDFGRVAGAVALLFVTINGVTSLYNSGVLACARFKRSPVGQRVALEPMNVREGLSKIDNFLVRACMVGERLGIDINGFMQKLVSIDSRSSGDNSSKARQLASASWSFSGMIFGSGEAASQATDSGAQMRSLSEVTVTGRITLEEVFAQGNIGELLSKQLAEIEEATAQNTSILTIQAAMGGNEAFMQKWIRLNLDNKLQFIGGIVSSCATRLASMPEHNKWMAMSNQLNSMISYVSTAQ